MVVKQGMGQDVICGEQMREWEELDRPIDRWRSKEGIAVPGIPGYFRVLRPEGAESEEQDEPEKQVRQIAG